MFTGIVEAVGTVQSFDEQRLTVECGLGVIALGESIAVAGCCLTVAALDSGIAFDLSQETASRTTLGALRAGDKVNIERAMRAGDRLGGHLVTGHIDGVGELLSRDGERFEFAAPAAGAKYLAMKGSVCVDGVSLTVAEADDERFECALVPHTLAVTTLGELQHNAKVNIEFDLIARYVERLLNEI